MFSPPIAIVGRACVLPGALSPEQLWQAVADGRDLLTSAPAGRWRVDPSAGLSSAESPDPDRAWSDRGGYVQCFEAVWNPHGFAVAAAELDGLAPLVAWTLHCARAARDACLTHPQQRVGAVFGNLGFPSERMAAYAQQVWRDSDDQVDPRNRYMSAGTARLLQQALQLNAGSYCIDAACASALYAIKLACDQLQAGSADLMLAGAVQGADDLFLHVGFSALNALSRTGKSRPFHADADGLVPAEGAAFFALKRLRDARRDGDLIHGVIRGIGLSNDGRGKGLLAPSAAGQQRAMRAAYAEAGMDAKHVGLLECHATGTPVGDATELASSAAVFSDHQGLSIGSLKSNLGHLITVAGAAGLIKVLGAMEAGQRPPTLHANAPNPSLVGSPFRLLQALEPWPSKTPRVAAISAFGFGGNNAHLIVSEDDPALVDSGSPPPARIAIVGVGAMLGQASSRGAFAAALLDAGDLRDARGEGRMQALAVNTEGLRFPPLDMQQTLPQQLAILQTSREALDEVAAIDGERCGVFIGIEPDPEVARYGARWRLPVSATAAARDAIVPALTAAAVLGCMPNIPANRLSSLLDLRGPAFTVQAGTASGVQALRIAAMALARGEIDTALVGAVDFSCEAVQRSVSAAPPADAAFSLLLKRLDDAQADGDAVYAWFESATNAISRDGPAGSVVETIGDGADCIDLGNRFGTAFAAHGLLHVSAAVLCLRSRCAIDGTPQLEDSAPSFDVRMRGSDGLTLEHYGSGWAVPSRQPLSRGERGSSHRSLALHLERSPAIPPSLRLRIFAGPDKQSVIAALREGSERPDGPSRLVLVSSDAQFDDIRARALAHLARGAPAGKGVHFRELPIEGELAFVFAGAGASYHGMGRSLLQHLPFLRDRLAERSRRLPAALAWAVAVEPQRPTALQQLWAASALSQLHLELTQGVLGLKADAWLGYSSGETNALVASGAWRDPDALMDEMEASGLMTDALGGRFAAVERVWKHTVDWASWTVLAPLEAVQAALADQPQVHLAIINSDRDCLIAGDAAGCAAVVAQLGESRCLKLDYPLAVHVPELAGVAAEWLQLHRRETTAPAGRIYSNAYGRAYAPDTESCARAILEQADRTLDLRPAVVTAWNDGVRVFVEHGPGGAYGRAIRSILGEREALVVALDRKGQGIEATLNAVAALLAAGVPVRHDLFSAGAGRPRPAQGRLQTFAAHPPQIVWPRHDSANPQPAAEPPVGIPAAAIFQRMAPAPRLPAVGAATLSSPRMVARPQPQRSPSTAPAAAAVAAPLTASQPLLALYQSQIAQLAQTQRSFVEHQAQLQQRYLRLRQNALNLLLSGAGAGAGAASATSTISALAQPAAGVSIAEPISPTQPDPQHASCSSAARRDALVPGNAIDPNHRATAIRAEPDLPDTSVVTAPAATTPPASPNPAAASSPRGPTFTRQQLEVHASGRIADLFGPDFAHQDAYRRQVRMPLPPLLLADRVTGLDAVPDSMGSGVIWTESDVRWDGWYLHQDRMPAGVLIEAGQADLLLISWLGVDRCNRGERVYRLLGCELTYHGDLPRAGDTVQFAITLDGHAAQGDVRLMFFHYDCHNDGRPQLSVRKGQAGFFSDAELADSAGCLWTPELQAIVESPQLDPPAVAQLPTTLDRDQLRALASGDAYACFGAGYERAQTHTRTPGLQGGRMLLLDRVVALSASGGPWGRGYLRAELDIDPAQWFFEGHFKNDPCMPGTLMFEGCLQALAVYLLAHGYALDRDGWRFQPVPELPYPLQCRGQVTPASKRLVTEVFVEEISAGPLPTVYADLLCTVDGLKAFHARRVALQLVPDWPLRALPALLDDAAKDARPCASVDGFRFDQQSLLACAIGRPSDAFGPIYRRFDGPQRVARLPSPPYLFMSRIQQVDGPIGVMRAGARVIAEYDVPPDAWYFASNGCRSMPFAVLLEAALQPCGWLSSYVGSALTQSGELGFRNLDGDGELLEDLFDDCGTLITEVTLTDVSATGGMIIEAFTVSCRIAEREVYRLQTMFGFFPPAALASQAGLRTDATRRELLTREGNLQIDLSAAAADQIETSRPRLANGMLLMLDRIEGHWPDAGKAGLGQLRAVKDIDAGAWFFKAHFFQDPVQPGSLGLEAMLQALQFHMLRIGLDRGIVDARFEPIALHRRHGWKYRGQVLPGHRRVHTTVEITEVGSDARGAYALADASLWADGQRIYEMVGLGMRIVSGRRSTP